MAKKKQTNLPAALTRTEILSRHPVEEIAKTAFRDGNGLVVRPVVTPRELVSAGILLRPTTTSVICRLPTQRPEK